MVKINTDQQSHVSLQDVLERLDNPTKRGDSYRAPCPAHDGKTTDSLSVKEGDDGKVITHCFGPGCSYQKVLTALDLWNDAPHQPSSNGSGRKKQSKKQEDKQEKTYTTTHVYSRPVYEFRDPAGEVLYVQRHKGAYFRPVGEDRWIAKEGTAKVPYNLPELIEGVKAGKTIFHVEGCKDADTATEQLGVPATTTGGVGTWRSEFRTYYVGADVVILPDNDADGLGYAHKVADDLAEVARSVKVVELPGLPEKGDLTDFLEAGGTPEQVFEAVEAASYYSAEEEEPWPEPRALDTALPPVAAFTADMLPEPLGSHVVNAARRMDNVAPEFIAAPMIVGAGTVIGRKVAVRPKARDDWQVICNLWGANVGEPSTMKTPAEAAGLALMTRLAAEARERFEARSVDHKLDAVEGEIREKHLRDALKKAVKEGDPAAISNIRQEMAELSEAAPPTEERYKTSDATIEKLGELLRDNPNGLLNDRDELMGWLSTLDRAGHEGDRAFFLEAWNGDNPYHVDRIGRGSIHVPALCLSIFGGIQPGPLTAYVRDALSESEKADGLLQRFQVLVWPDRLPYERVDESPDPNTKEAVFQVFKALAAFDPKEFGARFDAFGPEDPEQESEPDGVPYVRFTEDAQAVFDGWRDEFEPRIRTGAFPAAVEAHFLKYRSLFASLALVFEVLDYVAREDGERTGGAVGEVAAARAAAWCEFLESHAMRLYHPALMAPIMVAEALLDRIEAGDVAHKTKTRDIWRKGWQGLATAEDLRRALDVLEEHGWVRRETVKPAGGGRPSEQLHIHPRLRDES